MRPDLATLDEAAHELGIPKASLRTAAESHGFLVRMGRAIRIDRNDFKPLVKKCQDQPKGQGSTSTSTARNGTLPTQASDHSQQAALAAQTLKRRSRSTSPTKAGQVLPLNRKM